MVRQEAGVGDGQWRGTDCDGKSLDRGDFALHLTRLLIRRAISWDKWIVRGNSGNKAGGEGVDGGI